MTKAAQTLNICPADSGGLDRLGRRPIDTAFTISARFVGYNPRTHSSRSCARSNAGKMESRQVPKGRPFLTRSWFPGKK